MALYINGSNIPTSGTIYVNGTSITKVYMNNTLVWSKQALTSIAVKDDGNWINTYNGTGFSNYPVFQLNPAAQMSASEFTLSTSGGSGTATFNRIDTSGVVWINISGLASGPKYDLKVTLRHSATGYSATGTFHIYYESDLVGGGS